MKNHHEKVRCEPPPAAFGGSPPHEGENTNTKTIVPLVRGTAAEGGRGLLTPHLWLLVGFLTMLASAAAGQVKTAKPGEPVERHLSADQTLREWSLDPNVTDDVKRIKVCRVETVCK